MATLSACRKNIRYKLMVLVFACRLPMGMFLAGESSWPTRSVETSMPYGRCAR